LEIYDMKTESIPAALQGIVPEFEHLIPYTKPGEGYLIGPAPVAARGIDLIDQPTVALTDEASRQWMLKIRHA
jgi:hypothetical protein